MGRRILVAEENAELRPALEQALARLGYEVVTADDPAAALARADLDEFSLIIFDLTDESLSDQTLRKHLFVPVVVTTNNEEPPRVTRLFRAPEADMVRRPYDEDELARIIDEKLSESGPPAVEATPSPDFRERIEFDLPSELRLMDGVLNYLIERLLLFWDVTSDERSGLYIALIEAFVNAIKHGNKNDPSKSVRLVTELSPGVARFTVEDEGEGFNTQEVPHPRDTGNLLKASGRGIFLINSIMDQVEYNERGNRLTMTKRLEHSSETGGTGASALDELPAKS